VVSEKNPYGDVGIVIEEGWQTIDKVLRPETQLYYSSKPPLLPTLLAGEYWLLKHVFSWSITEQSALVMRTILFTVNWLPLLTYLLVLAQMVDRWGATDWGRLYVFVAGCFATYLVPFAVTLNNHLIASWSGLFALYFSLRAWGQGEDRTPVTAGFSARARSSGWVDFGLAGLFAGFTATNELPALALTAVLFVLLLSKRPASTLAIFVPAALAPIGALLLTNYLALGQLSPAYGEFGGPWYEYPGSHWRDDPTNRGIDWAWKRESHSEYVFHYLLGHHGLFSLSPIFLLAVAGMAMSLMPWRLREKGGDRRKARAMAVIGGIGLALTLIVVGFYLFVTDVETHNYGGWTSGPRQLMWLTPFLLLAMLPCVDWLASGRVGRGIGYVLLAFSVLSVNYPAWNPWRHPWIYDFMNWQGWIGY
jgi:hypothetical protein